MDFFDFFTFFVYLVCNAFQVSIVELSDIANLSSLSTFTWNSFVKILLLLNSSVIFLVINPNLKWMIMEKLLTKKIKRNVWIPTCQTSRCFLNYTWTIDLIFFRLTNFKDIRRLYKTIWFLRLMSTKPPTFSCYLKKGLMCLFQCLSFLFST